MRVLGGKLRGAVFAAALVGSLGFGAAGALAGPAEAAPAAVCNPETCDRMCKARHGPFAHGECWDDQCLCAI